MVMIFNPINPSSIEEDGYTTGYFVAAVLSLTLSSGIPSLPWAISLLDLVFLHALISFSLLP